MEGDVSDAEEHLVVSSSSSSSKSPRKETAFDWDLYSDRTQALASLRERRAFVDAILVSEDGGEEMVHLAVISALGQKVTQIMYQQLDDPSTPSVAVKDATGQEQTLKKISLHELDKVTLKVIVDCAYTGLLSASLDTIWEMVRIGEIYEMRDVITACCSYLTTHLKLDNCIRYYQLASKHSHEKLLSASLNAFKYNFTQVVGQNMDFSSLSVVDLEQVLGADDLNVSKESVVWLAVKEWVLGSKSERMVHLSHLLTLMRHHRVPPDFLKNLLEEEPLISENLPAEETVNRMIIDRERGSFSLDGHQLPASASKAARPRIPYEILFAVGGWKEGIPTSLIETYDHFTNTWFVNKHENPFARAYHGLEFIDGLVYMVGGTNGQQILKDVCAYNPVTGEWTEKANMSQQRCYVSTVVLGNNIYAIGGHTGEVRVRSAEKYDPVSNKWTSISDMFVARSDGCAAVLKGKIYIAGGLNENLIERSVEFFNPETGIWTMVRDMSSPRTSLALINLKGTLYALGGNNGAERLSSVEKYDDVENSWEAVPGMNTRRSTFASCVIDNKLIAIGGYDGQTPVKLAEYFDDVSQEWTSVRSIKYDRSGLSVIVLKGLPNAKEFTFLGNIPTSKKQNKSSLLRFFSKSPPANETEEEWEDIQ